MRSIIADIRSFKGADTDTTIMWYWRETVST